MIPVRAKRLFVFAALFLVMSCHLNATKIDSSKKAQTRVIQPSVQSATSLKKYQNKRYKSKVIDHSSKIASSYESPFGVVKMTPSTDKRILSQQVLKPSPTVVKKDRAEAWTQLMSKEEFRTAYEKALAVEMNKRAKVPAVSRPSESQAIEAAVDEISKRKP